MAKKTLERVLQHIRVVAAIHAFRNLADSELLDRFIRLSDEAAFTVLVERHGPMVLGVCRRALHNLHDAEEGCQATFLVLARKAPSIRKNTALASWLHGVACRLAAGLKRARARRQRRDQGVMCRLPKDTDNDVSWREMQTILDEELEQLPQRYRTPLILCYLNGSTRDEAARQLGLSLGSLHGRLERGRNLLRARLTRRGVTLSVAMFAPILGDSALHAALPAGFVVSSTKAALALAAGQPLAEGVVSASVLTLTREVLNSMLLTKLKLGAAAALCACLFTALAGASLTSLDAAQDVFPPAQAFIVRAPKTESDEDFIRRMSKDLRGHEPTPTEIHFFVASAHSGKRQKLIDLLIQERQAKKKLTEAELNATPTFEGTLLPIERITIYTPMEGQITSVASALKSGGPVFKGQELLRIYDNDLADKIRLYKTEIAAAEAIIKHVTDRNNGKDKSNDQPSAKDINDAKVGADLKAQALENLRRRTNSLEKLGEFAVKSPRDGILLSPYFRENLIHRYVKPNEPLLRVGYTDVKNPRLADWEIELKIPQKQIGQVLEAFRSKDPKDELDVDLVLTSAPTRTYKGKLSKAKIASPNPSSQGNNAFEPVFLAWVRISGSNIPEEHRLTVDLLIAGTEVHARIRLRSNEK